MLITIDGPIATGKSTIAKKLAEELGYIYFDTGAMYRGLTWLAIQKKCNIDDPEELKNLLKEYIFEIRVKQGERRYWVNKQDVSEEIRKEEVTSQVSKISANPVVREKLVSLQRNFAIGVNAVFEGRDMGTVVFPQADIKIFLTARPEVRAKRRFDELKAKYPDDCKGLTLEQALENVNRRDDYDTKREASPLRQAKDAILIDTSDLSIDDIVMQILEIKDEKRAREKHKS